MSTDLKFWHCNYCHKGLTARDLHDITDHKVRCWNCFESPIAPKPPQPTIWDSFWNKVDAHYPVEQTTRFAITEKGRKALEEMKK